MEILYHDLTPLPSSVTEPLGATYLPLEELLPRSDFVSLHVNLSAGDAAPHQRRDAVVDEADGRARQHVAWAGHRPGGARRRARTGDVIFAAALDVTDPEPIPMDDRLVGRDDCLIVPHIASASRATRGKMAEMAAANLLAGVRGEPLPTAVATAGLTRRAERATAMSNQTRALVVRVSSRRTRED